MHNENLANGPEIPMGLGMALAKDVKAMEYFAALPDAEKQAIIEGTHQIHSKAEMAEYVRHFTS